MVTVFSLLSFRSFVHASAGSHQDDNVRSIPITRIYADEDGHSKFGSFVIKMKGSGEPQGKYCCAQICRTYIILDIADHGPGWQ